MNNAPRKKLSSPATEPMVKALREALVVRTDSLAVEALALARYLARHLAASNQTTEMAKATGQREAERLERRRWPRPRAGRGRSLQAIIYDSNSL